MNAARHDDITTAAAVGFRAPGASNTFDWRASSAPQATTPPPEEDPMAPAAKPRRARKTSGASPQFQICAALMAHGDLAREDLHAKLDGVTAQQLASALNNAKVKSRIVLVKDKFRITPQGQAWATGGANLDNQQAAAPKAARAAGKSRAHRRERTAKPAREVDTSPPPEPASDFCCAVRSDGTFWLRKNGQEMHLTVEEHRQMLAYQERMAVEA